VIVKLKKYIWKYCTWFACCCSSRQASNVKKIQI